MVLTIVLSSCGIEEIGGDGQKDSLPPVWNNPSSGSKPDNARNMVYYTGFEYPDGYDWKADPEKGNVKCSLIVYADKVPMMKVPVGDSYHVSSDPDMHRIIDGHLYTDFPVSGETVIKKDGVELFRFIGEESLTGMIVKGKDVYTLGQNRSGDGFAFRKNGDVILKKERGHVFDRLQQVGDSLYFAYAEQIDSEQQKIERYYHVTNGRVTQVAVRDDVKKVWDIMMHNGQVCCLAALTGVSDPVVIAGDALYMINIPSLSTILNLRLFDSGKSLCAEGTVFLMGVAPISLVWSEFKLIHAFQLATVHYIDTSDGGISCITLPMSGEQVSQIYKGGSVYDLPQGYVPMGKVPLAISDGIVYSVLSSSSGEYPLIWKEGQIDTLKINGFLSSVVVCKASV